MPNYPHLILARQPCLCAAIAVACSAAKAQCLAVRHRLAPGVGLKRLGQWSAAFKLLITALAAIRSADQIGDPI
jgi:hypothetical protein